MCHHIELFALRGELVDESSSEEETNDEPEPDSTKTQIPA